MKVKIEVTAEDIEKGVQRKCRKCPIARAVLRRFPEAEAASAGDSLINVLRPYGLSSCIYFSTPDAAFNFMGKFDREMIVKPFTFEMEEAV